MCADTQNVQFDGIVLISFTGAASAARHEALLQIAPRPLECFQKYPTLLD